MIERIEGEFLDVGGGHIVVAVSGFALRLLVPRPVADRMRDESRGALWTRLIVRDGEPSLYAFQRTEERAAFDALIAVSGVGPRIALAILSEMGPAELYLDIERGSIEGLTRATGVGRKLASRILLELKGRLTASPIVGADAGATEAQEPAAEAIRALMALGYGQSESRDAVRGVVQASGGAVPLDRLVRMALGSLYSPGA